MDVLIREVAPSDLPILFEQQMDPEANQMAAFPARDWDSFMAHWTRILANPALTKMTIVGDGEVVGNIVCFERSGKTLVGYWIGRAYWGRGIATRALKAFLSQVRTRPLHAYVAKHNRGSIRVLEKCGFTMCGPEPAPPGAPGDEVEEVLMELPANAPAASERPMDGGGGSADGGRA